jgi:hypothetical protein
MGNLQGTYKFFSLETGKKIKRRKFTACPMPDSVIKKVEAFGKSSSGVFDFANRNGILFEWKEEVNECPEGIVKEDVVLYPSLIAEFPGVTLCWVRCRHCRQIIQEMNNLLAKQIIQDMNNLLAESHYGKQKNVEESRYRKQKGIEESR